MNFLVSVASKVTNGYLLVQQLDNRYSQSYQLPAFIEGEKRGDSYLQ